MNMEEEDDSKGMIWHIVTHIYSLLVSLTYLCFKKALENDYRCALKRVFEPYSPTKNTWVSWRNDKYLTIGTRVLTSVVARWR
jgi:hypothetical protein